MSKTRNGRSSSTKKGKIAKVSTKKLVGRGKRKTAKLGKVKCGGGKRARSVRRGVRSLKEGARSGVGKLGRSTPSPSALLNGFEKARLNSQISSAKKKKMSINEKIKEKKEAIAAAAHERNEKKNKSTKKR